jgi:hypothetical protein
MCRKGGPNIPTPVFVLALACVPFVLSYEIIRLGCKFTKRRCEEWFDKMEKESDEKKERKEKATENVTSWRVVA